MKKLIIPIILLFALLIGCSDQDSVQSPNVNQTDDSEGWSLIYSTGVEFIPPGESTGWVEFTPYEDAYTLLKFQVRAEIIQDSELGVIHKTNSESTDSVYAYVIEGDEIIFNESLYTPIWPWTDYERNIGILDPDDYCAFKVDVPSDFYEQGLLLNVYQATVK